MNQMTSEKYLNFFFTKAFWKFQHLNLVSKISKKLFKPLPCHKSIGKILHAISAVAVSLSWVCCGPWASCSFFWFFTFIPVPLSSLSLFHLLCYFFSPFLWETTQNDPQGLICSKTQHNQSLPLWLQSYGTPQPYNRTLFVARLHKSTVTAIPVNKASALVLVKVFDKTFYP